MTLTATLTAEKPRPDLRLIRADNPSPMTGTGTNTYLLGRGQLVLIDPGPDLPAHLTAIRAALAPKEQLAAILLTHGHADHAGLVARLQAETGAPTYGFGPPGSGRSSAMRRLARPDLPSLAEGFQTDYSPDHRLQDGQTLRFGDVVLTALHTPGHTGCSLSFAMGDHLFTGDLAMGWASSLVAPPDGDMGDYFASLDRLLHQPWSQAWPGHGPAITAPAERLTALIAHRRQREAAILAALTHGPATPADLASQIYLDTPPALMPAAAQNVLAHLIHLVDKGQAHAASPLSLASIFHPA